MPRTDPPQPESFEFGRFSIRVRRAAAAAQTRKTVSVDWLRSPDWLGRPIHAEAATFVGQGGQSAYWRLSQPSRSGRDETATNVRVGL